MSIGKIGFAMFGAALASVAFVAVAKAKGILPNPKPKFSVGQTVMATAADGGQGPVKITSISQVSPGVFVYDVFTQDSSRNSSITGMQESQLGTMAV